MKRIGGHEYNTVAAATTTKTLTTATAALVSAAVTQQRRFIIAAAHVLDEVSEVCSYRLRHLNMVNASRRPFSLLAVASFVNLKCLVISPHNLGDDLVECIADMRRMRNLHIVTNSYTECVPTPVDYRVWKQLRRSNPKLRVHLVTEGKHSRELTFQGRAPVRSIVYNTPYTKVGNN